MKSPHILVTGIGGGIGSAIANELIQNGFQVSGFYRTRKPVIESFEKTSQIQMLQADFLDPHCVSSILGFAFQQKITGLVQATGFFEPSFFEATDEKSLNETMKINFEIPFQLMRGLVPYFRSQGEGRILNLSSIAALIASPGMSVYRASKLALEAACENLMVEVSGQNIQVCCLQAGFVETEMYQKFETFVKTSEARIQNLPLQSPDEIAGQVRQILESPEMPLVAQTSELYRRIAKRKLQRDLSSLDKVLGINT